MVCRYAIAVLIVSECFILYDFDRAAVEDVFFHTLRNNGTLSTVTIDSHSTISTASPNSSDVVLETVSSDVVTYATSPVFSTILPATKLVEQDVIRSVPSSYLLPTTQAERIYVNAGLVAALVFISCLRALSFYQV